MGTVERHALDRFIPTKCHKPAPAAPLATFLAAPVAP
jgi:hypothetical protein